jgi:hypothetical protein
MKSAAASGVPPPVHRFPQSALRIRRSMAAVFACGLRSRDMHMCQFSYIAVWLDVDRPAPCATFVRRAPPALARTVTSGLAVPGLAILGCLQPGTKIASFR